MQTYLIDGYNLLHAMGILLGRVGPHGLEKARLNLLGVLAGSFDKEADRLTVVFDAASAPAGVEAKQEYRDITVLFAQGGQEADDLIESLISRQDNPKNLVVISDDRRLQRAARHRNAQPMTCGDFLDLMDRRRQTRPSEIAESSPSSEKENLSNPEDTQHWLHEFRDLQEELDRHDRLIKPEKLPPAVPNKRRKPNA